MSKHRFAVNPIAFALRLNAFAAFALCLVQCNVEQPGDSETEPSLGSVSQALERCGGRACGSNADCKIGNPVCSVQATSYCLLDSPRECAWKLDTTNVNCRCIEHDIRLCTMSSGVAGNQICTKTSATSADWSTCGPCPGCTP